MDRRRIVLVGAGNVASHLARALDVDSDIVQVVARSIESANSVAQLTRGANPIDNVRDVVNDADYYIIAVNDDAVERVAAQMPRVEGIVAHTSGSVPMEALGDVSQKTGVFYPLQTFSRDAYVDISRVAFFIEGNTPEVADELASLARTISLSVDFADSARRAVLHLAAVFACNFSNYMWDCASRILATDGLSLDVMRPLLEMTLDKAFAMGPHRAQTGPARRLDYNVMQAHREKLPADMREIYDLLSRGIITNHKDEL